MHLFRKKFQNNQYKFIFGATTAILINLGLVVGLDSASNTKLSIISSILVVAIADNLVDSLGIHIYQETQNLKTKHVWISTLLNFLTRFSISLLFILIIMLLPLSSAISFSIFFGFILLSIISYLVARQRNSNIYLAITEHLSIALLVIFASYYLGHWIKVVLQ
jgi:VIT1/CCC1 family predicted Fe2+/Mn2+ transporter